MPIKQTIEIVWHPMTERTPRFARYLVAEANCNKLVFTLGYPNVDDTEGKLFFKMKAR